MSYSIVPHLWQTTYKCNNGFSKIETTYLTTNHIHRTGESADYFKELWNPKTNKSKAFVSKVTVSEKAQEASYLVALTYSLEKEKSCSW
jgi:hypothetical protein